MADMIDKALDARLTDRAREAWHPVSEPPTGEDGDHDGFILVVNGRGDVDALRLEELEQFEKLDQSPPQQWARIRDVVLLPPNQDT